MPNLAFTPANKKMSCDKKRQFPTMNSAEFARDRLAASSGHRNLEVYRCKQHDCFHIGHNDEKSR